MKISFHVHLANQSITCALKAFDLYNVHYLSSSSAWSLEGGGDLCSMALGMTKVSAGPEV